MNVSSSRLFELIGQQAVELLLLKEELARLQPPIQEPERRTIPDEERANLERMFGGGD